MSKAMMGLLIGTILGLLDGLSAYFTPATHSMMLQIVTGSTLKGLATGLAAGWVAKRYNSMPLAVVAGLTVGLVLGYLAAQFSPDPEGRRYYLAIMLPGAVLGLIVGFASQRFGRQPART